jgi:hypothetical protein
MNSTTIINNLKSEALAEALKAEERHLHYNGHKSIQGRRGYSSCNGLEVCHTIYASGRSRTTYSVGFASLNRAQAERFIEGKDWQYPSPPEFRLS